MLSFHQQVITLIATHCMNALHCILATRNIKTMLSSIRDTNQQSISYSKKLPKTLVSAFGKAQLFHAARLSNLTGADVQIKDDCLVIGVFVMIGYDPESIVSTFQEYLVNKYLLLKQPK